MRQREPQRQEQRLRRRDRHFSDAHHVHAGRDDRPDAVSYPDLGIDQSATKPFEIQTSNTFVCGTRISFSLNMTYASGTQSIAYSVHTCDGGPNQTIPASSIALSDPSQPDLIGRNQLESACSGKTCPGPINTAGTRNYKTFTFANTSGSAE